MYYAQNLIPNWSFEEFSQCPTYFGQLDRTVSWINPSTGSPPYTTGNPDYYNGCVPYPPPVSPAPAYVSVPNNLYTYQIAHSGVAYIGIYLQTGYKNVREYIEVPLRTKLSQGNTYHFEMYVNIANKCNYTTSSIGAYFSDTIVSNVPNYHPLPFTPQIINHASNVFDTLNWTFVQGEYLATGNESYLIIGNFSNDANSPKVIINGSAGNYHYDFAYGYIDDVSLTLNTLTGTQNNITEQEELNVFPNPTDNNITVSITSANPKEIFTLKVTNTLSQTVYSESLKDITGSFNKQIDLSALPKGTYFIELYSGLKNKEVKKIVLQ